MNQNNINTIHHTLFEIMRLISLFQGITIGCIGALLYSKNPNYFKFCFNKICQVACLILMVILITMETGRNNFHDTLISILSLILIIALIEGKSYFLKTENKALNYLGKISYGLYVWHPLIIWLLLRTFKGTSIISKEYLIWIICIATPLLSIGLADISYRLFEIKFLRIKRKYMIVPSSNIPENA